jgi:hypothetical protein
MIHDALIKLALKNPGVLSIFSGDIREPVYPSKNYDTPGKRAGYYARHHVSVSR